jgi:membrane protein implicated in regulation of membrane protease activity
MMEFVWIMLAALVAFVSGRNLIVWSVATSVFGPLTIIVVALLPKNKEKVQKRIDFIKEKSEEHVVKQEFQDVDNVDDLFKQLETPRG